MIALTTTSYRICTLLLLKRGNKMVYEVIDNVSRIESGKRFDSEDIVLIELDLEVKVNNKSVDVIKCCSPNDLEELIYGYLWSNRFIGSKEDVISVSIDKENYLANIVLSENAAFQELEPNPDFTLKVSEVSSMAKKFIPGSENFRSTGALHSVALCSGSDILFYSEDLSRHSALDKTLGKALLAGAKMSNCYVMTSGRIPIDVLRKVLTCGIPAICSRSAPSYSTILLARETKTILCGFVRENRMNIYNGKERVF
jgi:FdhD protein